MQKFSKSLVEGIGLSKPEVMPKHPIWFTAFSVFGIFTLSVDKLPIKELLSITIEPVIVSSHMIKTPEAVSFEGQMIEGNNLMFDLLLKQNIKYMADSPLHSTHIAYFESVKKCACIVMPTHYTPTSLDPCEIFSLYNEGKIIIKPYVEDVFGFLSDSRTIYISASLFIDAGLKRLL